METNLRIKEYLANKLNDSQFSVRVWRDKFDNCMIVAGYYCFCNKKFDMPSRQIILSEIASGSMLEKASELRNMFLLK